MSIDMHADNEMRELVASHVDAISVGDVAGLEQITIGARRRSRKTRLMGGLATIVVVLAMLAGVGTALRDSEPSAVFADQPAEELFVWRAEPFDDGFVALATRFPGEADENGNVPFVVATSTDGTRWAEVDDGPTFLTSTSTLAVHNDVVHIVTARVIDPISPTTRRANYVLSHALSTDLGDWDIRDQSLPAGLLNDEEAVYLQTSVAADAGVLVLLNASVANAVLDEQLALEEMSDVEICDRRVMPTALVVRECGQTESVSIKIGGGANGLREPVALFAPPGGDFEVSDTPPGDERRLAPRPTIYRAGTGFGFVGNGGASESVDGRTWQPLPLGTMSQQVGAARGDERLFRSAGAFIAPASAPASLEEWAYSNDGGATFDVIEGAQLPAKYRWFSDLTAVEGGWVMVASRTRTIAGDAVEIPGLTRDRRSFELIADGITLAGELPSGPAVLSDAGGLTLRRWDHFEPTNGTWSGLSRTSSGVSIPDEVSGEPLVEFTSEQIAGLISMPDGRVALNDILFSADAKTWTIVRSTSTFLFVHGVTDDEILVSFLVPAFDATSPEIVSIPLPTGN